MAKIDQEETLRKDAEERQKKAAGQFEFLKRAIEEVDDALQSQDYPLACDTLGIVLNRHDLIYNTLCGVSFEHDYKQLVRDVRARVIAAVEELRAGKSKIDFGLALKELRAGRAIYRHGWKDVLRLDSLSGIIYRLRSEKQSPWMPEHEDLLAEDWCVKAEE